MCDFKQSIWDAIIKECEREMEKDSSLVMYTDAEKLFYSNFNYYYNLIVNKFMKLKEKHLDRHKIAAVTICAILTSDILGIAEEEKYKGTPDDIFLANEKIALEIALSDMHRQLKQEFEQGKIPYESVFEKFVFPKPLSCDREYTEVICRDLYYAKKYFELDPLSIANFLFLLESYSFEAYRLGIDERKWDDINQERRRDTKEKELKQLEEILKNFDIQVENEKKELEDRKEKLVNELRKME